MRNCPEQFDFPPIFIVGVGRSGTTLAQSMLNAHPQVCFPPETHFLRRYAANGRAQALYAAGGPEALLADLESDNMLPRLKLDVRRVLSGVLVESRPFRAECLYIALMKAYAPGDQARIGDKDPRSIEFLPAIHRYFPGAYVVHVMRDPRDNIVSRMKAAWSSGRSFYHHLFVYNAQLRMGRRWGRELFAGRYVELVYERLIREPEETLRSVCRTLALDFDPQMLRFHESAKRIVTADELAWKKEALGPLLSDNTGKWVGVLTDAQVAATERLCGDVMTELGYPLSGKRWRGAGMVSLVLRAGGRFYAGYRYRRQKRAFS